MEILDILIFIGLSVPFFLLTVWALADVTMKSFPGKTREKFIWWITAIIPFIGWLAYLLIGFRRGKKADWVA